MKPYVCLRVTLLPFSRVWIPLLLTAAVSTPSYHWDQLGASFTDDFFHQISKYFPPGIKYSSNFILSSPTFKWSDHYNFCTCHSSWAAVTCAKIYSDLMARNRILVKYFFSPNLNNEEEFFSEIGLHILFYHGKEQSGKQYTNLKLLDVCRGLLRYEKDCLSCIGNPIDITYSYLYNGNSIASKMASLYWNGSKSTPGKVGLNFGLIHQWPMRNTLILFYLLLDLSTFIYHSFLVISLSLNEVFWFVIYQTFIVSHYHFSKINFDVYAAQSEFHVI